MEGKVLIEVLASANGSVFFVTQLNQDALELDCIFEGSVLIFIHSVPV